MPQTNVITETRPVLLFTLYNTKNIAYHVTEELIFYADKAMVMGNCKNSRVLNFVILLKSRKFDAREIYMFYSKDSAICSVSSAEASLFFGQLQNNTMSNDTDLSPAVSSSYSRSPVSCRAVSYDETTSKQTHCQTPINTTTI